MKKSSQTGCTNNIHSKLTENSFPIKGLGIKTQNRQATTTVIMKKIEWSEWEEEGRGGKTRLETCRENNQARFPPSINKGRNEGFEMMLDNYKRAITSVFVRPLSLVNDSDFFIRIFTGNSSSSRQHFLSRVVEHILDWGWYELQLISTF